MVIRNRWGKADNVVATLSTPSGASDADPYVVFQTASVNYGAVGSFNKDDNGITYDEGLLVTGVTNPFVFTVSEDTPNNHIIPFTLTMTANNGLEPEDANSYSFSSTFSLVVQRGRELPVSLTVIQREAAVAISILMALKMVLLLSMRRRSGLLINQCSSTKISR